MGVSLIIYTYHLSALVPSPCFDLSSSDCRYRVIMFVAICLCFSRLFGASGYPRWLIFQTDACTRAELATRLKAHSPSLWLHTRYRAPPRVITRVSGATCAAPLAG